MIGADPLVLPALEARRLGPSGTTGYIEPAALAEYEQLLLPARNHPRRLRGLPRQRRHRPEHDRASRAAGETHRLRPAGAVGPARRGARALRPAGAVACAMRRRRHGRTAKPCRAGHYIPEELPDATARTAAELLRAVAELAPGNTALSSVHRAQHAAATIGRDPSRRSTVYARLAAQARPALPGALHAPGCSAPWGCCCAPSPGSRSASAAGSRWLFLLLVALGLRDTRQTRHAVLRNYPVIGAPALPARVHPPRDPPVLHRERQRGDAVLARSSARWSTSAPRASPTSAPSARSSTCTPTATSGSTTRSRPRTLATPRLPRHHRRPDCAQPYSASVFNISAMSFGALSRQRHPRAERGRASAAASRTTPARARSARYHREHGGDLIWEIGSGYFGCRNDDGSFNAERFAANARDPQVKMIEIKLSQGAKPGHGGVLPGAEGHARDRRGARRAGRAWTASRRRATAPSRRRSRCCSSSSGCATLSGGKPAGFKLCIGHPWEWFAHRQGDAGDRHHARLHRRRRRRGRHRRGAAGVHRPRRRAAAGRPAAGAQHAGRR